MITQVAMAALEFRKICPRTLSAGLRCGVRLSVVTFLIRAVQGVLDFLLILNGVTYSGSRDQSEIIGSSCTLNDV